MAIENCLRLLRQAGRRGGAPPPPPRARGGEGPTGGGWTTTTPPQPPAPGRPPDDPPVCPPGGRRRGAVLAPLQFLARDNADVLDQLQVCLLDGIDNAEGGIVRCGHNA